VNFIATFLALTATPVLAGGEIVPTDDPGSDCVAAKISTERTERNRKYDERYCAGNKARVAYDNCLHNASANERVFFFTDRCNAPNEGAYLSFNGQTRQVWRQPGKAHPSVKYAGTYSAGDVVVHVVPRKLIRREAEDSEYISVSYAVDVIIKQGAESVIITAIYDDSR
jgi:hypothetical protein